MQTTGRIHTTLEHGFAVGRAPAMCARIVLMASVLVAGCGKQPPPDVTAEPVEDAAAVADMELSTPAMPDGDAAGEETAFAADDESPTPLPPAEPDRPRMTFAAFRQEIEALEANAALAEALQICREMAGQFTEPQQQLFIADTIVRLRNNQRKTHELFIALQHMEALNSRSRSVIWQKMTDAGNVGRIIMRIAVRDYVPEMAEEAGRLLVGMRDQRGVDTIIARLAKDPASGLSALFLDVLAGEPGVLDWNHLMQLCEASARSGDNQAAIVALVLDTLEHSVMTAPHIEADEDPLPAVPDWAKLAMATRTELQPEIVKAVLLLVEKNPPPMDDDDAQAAPVAEQTAARGLSILKRSGYVSAPSVALERLRHGPSRAAARHLVDLMQSTSDGFTILQLATLATIAANDAAIREPLVALLDQASFRLDSKALQALCAIIEQDAEHRVLAAKTLLDALTAWVTPGPTNEQNEESDVPDYRMLRLLMSADLRNDVTGALITLLEHAVIPPDAEADGHAPVLSDALLSRARALLIASRFEQLAQTAIDRLNQAPPRPVAALLVDLLGEIPRQLGEDHVAALCELSTAEGPNRALIMGLVVDILSWYAGAGRPLPDQPDETTAPDFSTLPARTGAELSENVVNAMVAYLLDHVPDADGEVDPDAAGAVERIRTILSESGYREIGPALLARLAQQPPAPVAEVLAAAMGAIAHDLDIDLLAQLAVLATQAEHNRGVAIAVLAQVPGRLNATVLGALCDLAVEPSDHQVAGLDLLLAGLGWAVGGGRPIEDQPDRRTEPDWKRLPFVIEERSRIKVSETLIDYVVQRATADAGEAEHDAHADMPARVKDVLVSSGCPFVPGALVARLNQAPPRPVAALLVDLLGEIPHQLGEDHVAALCELSTADGPNRTLIMGLVVDMLSWYAGAGRPLPDQPGETTAPDFSTLPARTGAELSQNVVNAMVAYLVDHVPDADGEVGPDAAEAVERIRIGEAAADSDDSVLLRSRRVLLESGYGSVPGQLVARLTAQPRLTVATFIAGMLHEIPDRLTADMVRDLSSAAHEAEGPYRDILVGIVIKCMRR